MGTEKRKKLQLNDEIDNLTLHRFKPFILHLNIAPFFLSYFIWFFIWFQYFGVEDYPELGMIITAVIALLQVITCLFCYWFVEVRVFMQCVRENDPFKAQVVKITPTANNGDTCLTPLHYKFIFQESGQSYKQLWFFFQKTKYIYDNEDKKEFKAIEFPVSNKLQDYLESKGFQTDQQLLDATTYFGVNQMVMDIPKFIDLFIERATAPFFVFQVFCVLLWCLDEYWYYSLFTLFMLITFECTLVQQQLKNMQMIRQMGQKPYKIMVYRNRKWIRIDTDQLVPGDICSVSRSTQQDQQLPCDLVLLRGQCIVNESMLTGESVPVVKESIENRNNTSDLLDVQLDGKLHMLFGGTTIVQHTPPSKQDSGLKAQDNGCIAYVLRTGFNTSQGKLLRTIMYSVKRVTANNLETFLFILFLLVFAIAASSYVWIEGSKNPNRSRYKLLLECTLILTSVIPPELPIELALAVNSSLVSLARLGIFCTEPFRIPFAGKLDICCFDKTGTLTSDDLIVEGVTGINGSLDILPLSEVPNETINVLATCHTLINLDDEIIGDPLEKVTLQTIDWTLTKNEAVVPKKAIKSTNSWKIYQKFHFSSALKRMSVIAGHTKSAGDVFYIATCKGAPEVLKSMLKTLPDNYDDIYLHHAREGARVLCLAYKEIGNLSHQELRDLNREDIEKDLDFYGFVVISCPLKPDSNTVIREITYSSHYITMITGDNPLTAAHIASELKFIRKKNAFILTHENSNWSWNTIDDKKKYSLSEFDYKSKENHLCITGEGFDYLFNEDFNLLKKLIPRIKVFARVSPKQKEHVVTILKSIGYVTLMCGDGTNDVGALKHAHVGVALLSNSEYEKKKQAKEKELLSLTSGENANINNEAVNQTSSGTRNNRASHGSNNSSLATGNPVLNQQQQAVLNAQKRIKNVLKELEEAEQAHIVKLGDASIASPFTSKQSSIQCVCHIIKQGRCTLVTTLQMFKILALNALILAYSQSVLYLDGIKLSDGQATMQGLLLAGCFLFISRSKPLKVLSKTRPLPNIFNVYTILTVLLQFFIHLSALIYLTREAHARSPPREEEFPNLEAEFKPSLVNTVVYIISLSLQVATFAINYKGHPFMESLRENKPLLGSILFSAGAVFVLANRLSPETCDQFQVVDIPEDFRKILLSVIGLDLVLCYVLDRGLEFLFGKARVKSI